MVRTVQKWVYSACIFLFSKKSKKAMHIRGNPTMNKFRWLLRRLSRYRIALRFVQWCIIIMVLTAMLDLLRQSWRPRPPQSFSSVLDLRSNNTTSVYIASIQWNSEAILKSSWIPALLELVVKLQAANINVYVSIYEGGSHDGTKKALSQLADSLRQLSVDNSIELDDESHKDVVHKLNSTPSGWLQTPRGKELRRIVHLSKIRNRALEPLANQTKAGVKFDKILYLNDIVYSVSRNC